MNLITLKCGNCDKFECDICPIGTYVPEGSERGCIRSVTENIAAQYEYINEELMYINKNNKRYYNYLLKEKEENQNKIFDSPLVNKLDKNGKIVS
jgi:DNA-directed RNA polymerase beta subunit